MKNKSKTVFKTALTVFLSFLIFASFIIGYLYINIRSEIKKSEADSKENRIPYEEQTPEGKGVLLHFESGNYIMMYLDFKGNAIYLADLDDNPDGAEKYGFPTDYNVDITSDTVRIAVDISGGIELTVDDTPMRYTGVQVNELLAYSTYISHIRKQILLSFFENIGKNGITRDELINIFENSHTDLTVPDYYKWPSYLKAMSMRVFFVN